MARETLHVVPHSPGWGVKRAGIENPASTHETQKEAIEAANDLAKDGDVVVIHRADGTIRSRTTYSDNGSSNGTDTGLSKISPSDVVSVGTRVSWSAILAGGVVGLTTYATLSLLAVAVGLSTADLMRGKTFAITAGIVSLFSLLVSLFVAGFVTSRATVGEEKQEAIIYGLLVWAVMLFVLLLPVAGASLGVGAWAFNVVRVEDGISVDSMQEELGLSDRQAERYKAMLENPRGLPANISPQALAWWTVGGILLSMAAAIGGAICGAGPELVIRRLRDRGILRVKVA